MTQKKSLFDFLLEAELSQYHKQFLDELKVTTVSQVKYVTDVDLLEIGMTKPEIRRLNKFFKKYCNQGSAINKIKEILIRRQEELNVTLSWPGSNKSHYNDLGSGELGRQVIDAEAITLQGLMGEGEFGNVYQATWKRDSGTKTRVAVKSIKYSVLRTSVPHFLQFLFEYQQITDENIVRLFGVATNVDDIWLVMEFAPKSSLFTCLSSQSSRLSYPVVTLCDFAYQVAAGMEFLEKSQLVHRDLSSRNVLVFSGNKVKVSDVGLTRGMGIDAEYYKKNVSFNLKLPAAWCAPECMEHDEFTSASDVWAYGVTMWEMFSYGFQPWAGFTGKQISRAISVAGGSQRLDQPDSCPSNFYKLMTDCWQQKPENRPTFSKITGTVKDMKPVRMLVNDERIMSRLDCLNCKPDDIITVLESKPKNPPTEGMWKGVIESTGRVGCFDPLLTTQFDETKHLDLTPKSKLTRRFSSRRSVRSELQLRLHTGLISAPQSDLRHVSHVGYDGAVFGDVSFIGSNYDRLPFKVRTPERADDVVAFPVQPSPMNDLTPGNQSCMSFSSDSLSCGTDHNTSQETNFSISPETSMILPEKFEADSSCFDASTSKHDFSTPETDKQNQSDVSLDDFCIPDLSGTMDLDLSILDEMLKSFGKFEEIVDSAAEHGDSFTQPKAKKPTNTNKELDVLDEMVTRDSGVSPAKISDHFPSGNKERDKGRLALSWSSSSQDYDLVSQVRQMQPLSGDINRQEEMLCPPRGLRFELSDPGLSSKSFASGDVTRIDEEVSTGTRVLSKIGNVLSKRNEIRMKRSVQHQPMSSSSSSAEFLPVVEKLPSWGQKPTSVSLPRDGSLNSSKGSEDSEDMVERRRPTSFLRDSRSFSRTKAKIKSSVSSVLSSRGSSKKEPAQNININLQFFDRLREQEMENAKQEEELLVVEHERDESLALRNAARDDSPNRASSNRKTDEGKRSDYITRPLGLRLRNFDPSSSSDLQIDEGTVQISHLPSNSQTIQFHDSPHDSEKSSSAARQSDDAGVFADDSEPDSPYDRRVGRRSPSLLLVSHPACCHSDSRRDVADDDGGDLDVMHDVLLQTAEMEFGFGLGGEKEEERRYEDPDVVDELDFYENAMESVLDDGSFSDSSSYMEEATTLQVQLDDPMHWNGRNGHADKSKRVKAECLVNGKLGNVSRETPTSFSWDLNDASRYVNTLTEDRESPEYINV